MHLASRLPHRVTQDERAAALLGASHPFARTLRTQRTVVRQLLVVAALAAGAAIALMEHVPGAGPVVATAGATSAALAVAAGALAFSRRRGAVDLIADGHATVPLADVEHARARLSDPGNREILARALEARCVGPRTAAQAQVLPVACVRMLSEMAPELRRTAALVRAPDAGVRGIALVDRLVSDGVSPLYGTDPLALRQELRRIEFHLAGHRPSPGDGAEPGTAGPASSP